MLGRTIETRCVAGVRLDHPLAERLGERVAVGPAQAAGALGAEPDQLVHRPIPCGPLGGPAVVSRPARLCCRSAFLCCFRRTGGGGTRPPPTAVPAATRSRRRGPRGAPPALRDPPPAPPRDVRRGDVHVVGAGPRRCGSARAAPVPTTLVRKRLVDRRVEGDVAGAGTTVEVVGSGGTSARSPSMASTRSAISASTSPPASTTAAKIGFAAARRSGPRRWWTLGPDQQGDSDSGDDRPGCGGGTPRRRSR